jgi:hypothetical protein
MYRKLLTVITLATTLTCSGCVATQAVLEMGLYSDHYYLTNLYEDDNGNLYLQINHERRHYKEDKQNETDNFLVSTTKEEFVVRAYREGNLSTFKDDKGRDYLIHATYCGQDFGEDWIKIGENFVDPDAGLTLAKGLSGAQIYEKMFRPALKTNRQRKQVHELTKEEYDSIVNVIHDNNPHAALLRCRDTHKTRKKQPEYLASRIFLLPPAVIVDIITFPIQATIFYRNISKIH